MSWVWNRMWAQDICERKTLMPILHLDLHTLTFLLHMNEFHTSFLRWKETANAEKLHMRVASMKQQGCFTASLVSYI